MAVIGVTFATFSGQSRISARNFAQSVNQPQRDELMDYALAQLISDTADIRSAIRGHSLARDMYGNDAQLQRLPDLPARRRLHGPEQRPLLLHHGRDRRSDRHALRPDDQHPRGRPRVLRLQLHAVDAAGHVSPAPPTALPAPGWSDQTLEVLVDNTRGQRDTARLHGQHQPDRPGDRPCSIPRLTDPPTHAATSPSCPGIPRPGRRRRHATWAHCPFILDGRWLHAFNGPGMTTNAVHANFRYNGPSSQPERHGHGRGLRRRRPGELVPGHAECRWAGDHPLVPSPRGHPPASTRRGNGRSTTGSDWPTRRTAATWTWADSASRILRPVAADGHDRRRSPTSSPAPTARSPTTWTTTATA